MQPGGVLRQSGVLPGMQQAGLRLMHLSMLSPTYPLPAVVGEMVGI